MSRIKTAVRGLFLLGFLSLGNAQAATITWNNVDGGDFLAGANWVGGVAPGTNDTALFDSNAEYRVYFSGNATSKYLFVRDGKVTFDTGAFTYSMWKPTTGNKSIFIGDTVGGNPTFMLTNGYIYSDDHVYVPNAGRGSLIVDRATLFSADQLILSSGGYLVVTNGATVSAAGNFYTMYAGSTAVVSGASTKIDAGTGAIKYCDIYGTLRVEAGARVGSTRRCLIGGGGEVTLDSGNVWVRSEGAYTNTIEAGGVLQGVGNVMVSGTGVENTNYVFVVKGTVRPGNTSHGLTGTLAFKGAKLLTQQTTGLFEMDLGGTNSGSFDRIGVYGNPTNCTMSLAGTCTVSLVNNYTPNNGDKFDLFDWPQLQGAFQTLTLPELPGPGSTWKTNNLYVTGEIEAVVYRKSGAMFMLH